MAMATVDELRKYLDKQSTDDDALLQSLLDSTSTMVERYTNRQFTMEPASDSDPVVTKTFSTRGGTRVRVKDLRSITSAVLGGYALTEADAYGYGGYNLIEARSGEPYVWMEI